MVPMTEPWLGDLTQCADQSALVFWAHIDWCRNGAILHVASDPQVAD